MMKVNPYLSFNGNCEEAFEFYRGVFGGDFDGLMRWKDNPECESFSEADKEKVMHVALPIGDQTILMGADHVGGPGGSFQAGNNFMIALHPDTRAECDRVFDGLSSGGNVIMPLSPAFWGSIFGCFTDKFGVNWMVESNLSGDKE